MRDTTQPCTIEGCDRLQHCQSMCQLHYCRVRKYGSPGPAQPKTKRYDGPQCTAPGCERERRGGAYCGMHSNRVTRHGDPSIRLPHVTPSGPDHPNWLDDDEALSYVMVHHRIRRVRGRAAEHQCTRCDSAAAHWALMPDRAERLLTVDDRTFSANPDDYDPMCASCHRRMDMAHRAARTDAA